MRNARTVHLESIQGPVSGRDSAYETCCDVITLELHRIECVELAGPRRLFQDFVDGGFQVGVERLEQIFEQKCKKLPCADGKDKVNGE